ncbi:MAG TPA: oligosaccharide flippase family protein [Fimbriimonadaceae bacterium]|nr:oligosaccharide flippase family protein [Fimbriimonadaceae bacterium]
MSQPVLRRKAAYVTFAGSTATTLVASVQALLLMPLYLHYIGPKLYGAWLASGDLLVFMLAFDMGIPNLIIQRIGAALATHDKRTIGAYFGTGAAILLTFSALLGIALISVSPFIAGWMHIEGAQAQQLRGAFLLGSGAICTMLVNYIFQGLARGIQETTAVNISAFVGVVLGFAVTLTMLLSGYGVWSIAAGLAVRSGTVLIGCLGFLFFGVDREIRRHIRLDRAVGREFWRISPPLFISGLGYTLMNDSQVLLAATVLGPESATVFGLTRKAAEMAGTILDGVGQGSFGGFSHLYASGDGARSKTVYREVVAVYLGVGFALMCAYVAVNPGLVGVWAGPKMFGGTALTVLLAISVLMTGWSYLSLCLYRSTNHHHAASGALLLECVCRVPLMYAFLRMFGLPGIPVGAISTSLISGLWAHFRIVRLLPADTERAKATVQVWTTRLAFFGFAAAVCVFFARPSWSFVVLAGAGIVALAGLVFLRIDPSLLRMKSVLERRFAGAR